MGSFAGSFARMASSTRMPELCSEGCSSSRLVWSWIHTSLLCLDASMRQASVVRAADRKAKGKIKYLCREVWWEELSTTLMALHVLGTKLEEFKETKPLGWL